MPLKDCDKQCSGCALKPGGAANREPLNRLTAELAVLGPFPFYCHEFIDYSKNDGRKITRADFQEMKGNFRICTGWREAVAELAKTGYYHEAPLTKKIMALQAHDILKTFSDIEDAEEKKGAVQILKRLLMKLTRNKRRFVKTK